MSEATPTSSVPVDALPGGQRLVEGRPVDRGGAKSVVERAEDLGRVDSPFGPVEAGPPGEEHLGHEIQDELLGLFGRVHRREQPGHLPERAELEDGVVQRGLPLEQDAPQLEHHAEAERQRHGDGAHVARHRLVGVDDHLGLAAAQARDLLGVFEPLRRPDPRQRVVRRHQREPDQLALEAANEGDPATLEQLPFGPGQPACGRECTGKGEESAGGG